MNLIEANTLKYHKDISIERATSLFRMLLSSVTEIITPDGTIYEKRSFRDENGRLKKEINVVNKNTGELRKG